VEVRGAESLEFRDRASALAREFRVRLPRLNLLARAEERHGAGTLVRDGVVTAEGLALLKQKMPELDPARLAPGLKAAELGRLVTAETFVRLVRQLLTAKDELLARPCSACAAALVPSPTAPELTCTGCGASFPLPPGDDVLL
jgi:hypothetical protein